MTWVIGIPLGVVGLCLAALGLAVVIQWARFGEG